MQGKHEHVLVVSLQKSGTHLIADLMRKLGYTVFGWIIRDRDAPLPFDRQAREIAASLVLSPMQRRVLRLLSKTPLYDRITEKALYGLMLSWGERLGVPWASRHGHAYPHMLYSNPRLLTLSRKSIEHTPPNSCMIKHELPLAKTDGAFIRHWTETGKPAIIFNYRDPRDVLLSFINYFTGKTKTGKHGGFAEYFAYQDILNAIEDPDQRLMHAIMDPSFPGHQDFYDSLWMLRHPKVCKVSYEELVGSAGGGSDEAQTRAVARVLEQVGIQADPAELADGLYNTKSFTFHKGQIGKWKEAFQPMHHAAFNARQGEILKAYGYEPAVGNVDARTANVSADG